MDSWPGFRQFLALALARCSCSPLPEQEQAQEQEQEDLHGRGRLTKKSEMRPNDENEAHLDTNRLAGILSRSVLEWFLTLSHGETTVRASIELL